MNLIKYLTPTNLAEERSRFFSSKIYNPKFEYAWEKPEAIAWVEEHPKFSGLLSAIKVQDVNAIRVEAERLFDTSINPEFLHLAREIVSSPPKKNLAEPIEHVVASFQKAFDFLELNDYSIEVVDQHGFNFRPSVSNNKIIVSKYLNLDFFSIDGEVKHELVHVIRYINGKFNGIRKSHDYLPTEEGLATFYQDYAGENGQASLFQHAAEYTMTEIALNGSLRDMIEYLESIGFSKELAWQRAIRHKFGFVDTSRPGDIMKPSMYFYHQQVIKGLSSDERFRLFVGKIAVDQLPNFPEYRGKIPQVRLLAFYKLSI